MDFKWSGWKPSKASSPYIDWWKITRRKKPKPASVDDRLVIQRASSQLDFLESILESLVQKSKRTLDEALPVPGFAENAGFEDYLKSHGNWFPDPRDLPEVDDDTVIVGVIDTGIALGHDRTRNPDGTTRILAAWQQIAEWAGDSGKSQKFLPFGRELYKHEIDAALRDHSGGDLRGWLDEDSFNRATGTLDMRHVFGHHELAGRFAHGTHVLDAAAGVDPADRSEAEFQRRVKVIAVNLPGSIIFGESGTFLDSFMIYAIRRISDLADAIWRKNHPDWEPGDQPQTERAGYPVVMNISFGKQAGSKTTLDRFPATLKKFREDREKSNLAPVYFVMPVGNDNLARCNAFLTLSDNETGTLDWRILPEDQSANFVEIWSEIFSHRKDYLSGKEMPLKLAVVPPGSDRADFLSARHGQRRVLQPKKGSPLSKSAAAIYSQVVPDERYDGTCRLRYVVCVAPTLLQSGDGSAAPAGTWRLQLRNKSGKPVKCVLSVQTDQAILPGRAIGMRSYFDDENYRLYDESGRLVDSYEFPALKSKRPKNLDLCGGSIVRRHGTMNASAAHKAVARVGGYRSSDGKPAPYSATGRGRWCGADDGTGPETYDEDRSRAPTASLPTDDGPAHFGILAAGAANGSVVAMRGTSFASSQATRLIVQSVLKGGNPKSSAYGRLLNIANNLDDVADASKVLPGRIDIDNVGAGRIASPLTPRVSRTGRE